MEAALVVVGHCGGTCTAFAREGASCDFDFARCDEALRCRGDVCQPPFAAGDPCDETNYTDCANDGFWCDLEAGVCRELVGEGQTCNSVDGPECRYDLNCVATSFFVDGTCLVESAEGGPCSDEGDCEEGLACPHPPGMIGACTPPAEAGGPCEIEQDCRVGLVCSRGACVEAPGIGEICERRCAGDALCDGVCKAPRYPGEPCDATSICLGSSCEGGVCETRAPLGASCATGDECASRSCESGMCTDTASCL